MHCKAFSRAIHPSEVGLETEAGDASSESLSRRDTRDNYPSRLGRIYLRIIYLLYIIHSPFAEREPPYRVRRVRRVRRRHPRPSFRPGIVPLVAVDAEKARDIRLGILCNRISLSLVRKGSYDRQCPAPMRSRCAFFRAPHGRVSRCPRLARGESSLSKSANPARSLCTVAGERSRRTSRPFERYTTESPGA